MKNFSINDCKLKIKNVCTRSLWRIHDTCMDTTYYNHIDVKIMSSRFLELPPIGLTYCAEICRTHARAVHWCSDDWWWYNYMITNSNFHYLYYRKLSVSYQTTIMLYCRYSPKYQKKNVIPSNKNVEVGCRFAEISLNNSKTRLRSWHFSDFVSRLIANDNGL